MKLNQFYFNELFDNIKEHSKTRLLSSKCLKLLTTLPIKYIYGIYTCILFKNIVLTKKPRYKNYDISEKSRICASLYSYFAGGFKIKPY